MEMMNSESRADGENFEKYEQLIPECMLKLTLLSTQLQLLDMKRDTFWNHKESLFLKTPDVQISCLPYLFLLASSNLLCSVDWKWRMIGLVSVRPQTTLSKLRSPQVCHLFIDDGYGGLTRNPKTTVWRNDFEGFWAVSSSPFRSTKPSWAFWPGL